MRKLHKVHTDSSLHLGREHMKKYSLLVVSLLAFTIAVEAKKKEVYDAMEELNPLKVQRITRRLLGDLTNKNISDFITFADQVLEEQKKNLSLLNSWRDCAKIAVGGGLLVGALYYAKMLLSGDETSAYSRPMDSKEAARGSDSGLRGTGYQLPASAGYYQQGLTCGVDSLADAAAEPTYHIAGRPSASSSSIWHQPAHGDHQLGSAYLAYPAAAPMHETGGWSSAGLPSSSRHQPLSETTAYAPAPIAERYHPLSSDQPYVDPQRISARQPASSALGLDCLETFAEFLEKPVAKWALTGIVGAVGGYLCVRGLTRSYAVNRVKKAIEIKQYFETLLRERTFTKDLFSEDNKEA